MSFNISFVESRDIPSPAATSPPAPSTETTSPAPPSPPAATSTETTSPPFSFCSSFFSSFFSSFSTPIAAISSVDFPSRNACVFFSFINLVSSSSCFSLRPNSSSISSFIF